MALDRGAVANDGPEEILAKAAIGASSGEFAKNVSEFTSLIMGGTTWLCKEDSDV